MSHEGEEDLLEYSDNEQEIQIDASKAAEAGETGAATSATEGDNNNNTAAGDKKGSYVGIHSTGFKDFLLKPELSRAIIDCGFEHPSEVQQHTIPQSLQLMLFPTSQSYVKITLSHTSSYLQSKT